MAIQTLSLVSCRQKELLATF